MIEEPLYSGHDNLNRHLEYKKDSGICWGAIFAGTLTSIALSILFSFLIAGMGLGVMDMQSDNPLSGVGTVFNIFSALGVLLSLAAGGYMAGRLAGKSGIIHGFLNWALMTLITTLISAMAITATARLASSAVSTTLSAAGSAMPGTSQLLKNTTNMDFSNLFDSDNSLQSKIKNGNDTIKQALNNTEIDALKTDNLERVFNQAKRDIQHSIKAFKQNPQNFRNIADDLIDTLRTDAETITKNINRSDVVNELMRKGWSQSGAETAADNAISVYNNVKNDIIAQIDKIDDTISNAPQNFEEMKNTAADKINDAANTVRNTTLWTFFGGLLSALISALAGMFGEKSRYRDSYAVKM